MQFYYLDPQAEFHFLEINQDKKGTLIDVDVAWLSIGHEVFTGRLHSMSCYEKLVQVVPEDHQFAFRDWYELRSQTTHCIWYSLPKPILKHLPDPLAQVKSFIFELSRFFPPECKKQSVICFVNIPGAELVAGYTRGHCLCFKKLPAKTPLNFQHEWHYFQQMYPQWSFDHSLLITCDKKEQLDLIQTHQHTIHLKNFENNLDNRVKLYGFD